jgi:hypothetical protein
MHNRWKADSKTCVFTCDSLFLSSRRFALNAFFVENATSFRLLGMLISHISPFSLISLFENVRSNFQIESLLWSPVPLTTKWRNFDVIWTTNRQLDALPTSCAQFECKPIKFVDVKNSNLYGSLGKETKLDLVVRLDISGVLKSDAIND